MFMTHEIHQKIVKILNNVGVFQLKHFRNVGASKIDMKAAKETVSFVDVESEKMLKAELLDLLPETGFFGEELGEEGPSDRVWIVDPIDGTTNYLSGIDYFSISIAYVVDRQPVYGIVYKPYSGEYIYAIQGEGVFLNEEKIDISTRITTPEEALFVTGFPYRSEDLNDAFFEAANKVLRLGRGIRRNGSAALDLAHLAAGWYGGFWESDLQPYDVAAAICIMSEADILFTDELGDSYDMFKSRIMVAAPKCVHEPLRSIIAETYKNALA